MPKTKHFIKVWLLRASYTPHLAVYTPLSPSGRRYLDHLHMCMVTICQCGMHIMIIWPLFLITLAFLSVAGQPPSQSSMAAAQSAVNLWT